MFEDFIRAVPEPRGCGDREEGGVYAESGISASGNPLEHFLFDPPLPLLNAENADLFSFQTPPDFDPPAVRHAGRYRHPSVPASDNSVH